MTTMNYKSVLLFAESAEYAKQIRAVLDNDGGKT